MRGLFAVCTLAMVLAPLAAQAQELGVSSASAFESPRTFFLELNGAFFSAQPKGPGHPGASTSLFGAELDRSLWRGVGSLSAGLALDYATGQGTAAGGESAPSLTTLPVRLLVVYRFDLFARSGGIPLVPFLKFGLAHTLWWGAEGSGPGRWGYAVAGGLSLDLSALDPALFRALDRQLGVNSLSLQAQFTRITADDFGRAGLDLSVNKFLFGLGLEF